VWIANAHGERFLDCLSGFGVFNVGHRNPTVVRAVQAQIEKQPLHSQEFLDPLRAYAASLIASIMPVEPANEAAPHTELVASCPAKGEQRIAGSGCTRPRSGAVSPLTHVFFVNSGAEAVEAAIKLAMLHTGRKRLLACLNGFHGKTLGALSTTSKALFRAPFVGAMVDVVHVPFNDAGALQAAFDAATFTGTPFAAAIIEPVQGEGGIHVATSAYLHAARRLCTAHGTCLVMDEIQSGLGRTGRMFACEHAGVVPDLMCIGKSLSGGVVPIAACCGSAGIWSKYVESPFLFTTTFGGGPLACAAAIATIHVLLAANLPDAARERGRQLAAGLNSIAEEYPDVIAEVRGQGLMLGVQLVSNEVGVAWSRALLARKVLVSGTLISATTIRVCPPLVISKEEVDIALAACRAACADVRSQQDKGAPKAKL
jgi:putrescine aminotransferase